MPADQPPRIGLNHYFAAPNEPSQIVTVFQDGEDEDAALFARFHDSEPEDGDVVLAVRWMAGRFEWIQKA
jgi:hypothetical protein